MMLSSRRYLTTNKKLKNTSNPILQILRDEDWNNVIENNDQKNVLYIDVSRGVLINGQDFRLSPEHEQNSNALNADHSAIDAFIKRVMFNNKQDIFDEKFPTLLHFYHQSLNSVLLLALNTAILTPIHLSATPDSLSNLLLSDDGHFYFDTIVMVKKLHDIEKAVDLDIVMPGSLYSRHKLTSNGFKLIWVEFSNPLLEVCLNDADYRTRKKMEEAIEISREHEYQTYIQQLKTHPDETIRNIGKDIIRADQEIGFARQDLLPHLRKTRLFTKSFLSHPFNETYQQLFASHIKELNNHEWSQKLVEPLSNLHLLIQHQLDEYKRVRAELHTAMSLPIESTILDMLSKKIAHEVDNAKDALDPNILLIIQTMRITIKMRRTPTDIHLPELKQVAEQLTGVPWGQTLSGFLLGAAGIVMSVSGGTLAARQPLGSSTGTVGAVTAAIGIGALITANLLLFRSLKTSASVEEYALDDSQKNTKRHPK